MPITVIITTVILIDLIISSFIIIIIISDVIIEPGERRRAVICFASTGCSLIKKPRTAATPLTCVYSILRVCVQKKGKKGRKGAAGRGESRGSVPAAFFCPLVSTVLLKHLGRAELKSKLPATTPRCEYVLMRVRARTKPLNSSPCAASANLDPRTLRCDVSKCVPIPSIFHAFSFSLPKLFTVYQHPSFHFTRTHARMQV